MSDIEFDTSDAWPQEETTETTEPQTDAAPVDLDYLKALLDVLTKSGVQAFQIPGMSVAFQERSDEERQAASLTPEQKADEERSTSPKAVAGFNPDTSGFKNPKLWSATNGKRLKLDGSYE